MERLASPKRQPEDTTMLRDYLPSIVVTACLAAAGVMGYSLVRALMVAALAYQGAATHAGAV
jgi:hypothetical protein